MLSSEILRHLFADLDFSGRVEDAPLLEAVTFLQSLLRQGKAPRQTDPSAFPVSIIPTGLRRYLFGAEGKCKERALEIDRYEFLIYRLLRNALEAGDVYVQDSAGFRRFEDNLIDDARWQNKDAVLHEIGAPLLLAPIEETLAALREEIEARFGSINKRIEDGSNKHIKITGIGAKRRWTLIYPSDEEPVNSPFYSQLPAIDIEELLWFLPERQAFYATSLMCWTATSSMSPIHERFSPASSPWAPTWGCGRWRRYRGSAKPHCKPPPAITCE